MSTGRGDATYVRSALPDATSASSGDSAMQLISCRMMAAPASDRDDGERTTHVRGTLFSSRGWNRRTTDFVVRDARGAGERSARRELAARVAYQHCSRTRTVTTSNANKADKNLRRRESMRRRARQLRPCRRCRRRRPRRRRRHRRSPAR